MNLKKINQFKKDVDKLKKEFAKFSEKYGNDIAGFEIIKLKDSCWYLSEVIKDGRGFR
jgi:hypothetical protein